MRVAILPVRGVDEGAIVSTAANCAEKARLHHTAGAERDARHAAILAGDLAAREGQNIADNPFVRSGPDALIQHWLNGFHSVPIFQRGHREA